MRNSSNFFHFPALKITKIPLKYPALLLMGFLMLGPAAPAQQTPPTTTIPTDRGMPGLSPNPKQPDGTMVHMAERMARQRNTDRQKEIVADTARLLKLAQQLNVDVSKSNKDTLSLAVVKEANEIEKLAKTIKDKMKEGY